MQKKIVLVGGPGTGKSSVIKELISRGYSCMEEVSREVTLKAKKEGIDQLFLEKPLLFSELLLQGRQQQFKNAEKLNESVVFFDRGIPDVEAYLVYSNTQFHEDFSTSSNSYRYDKIFYFQPWKEIYESDNERYETYEQLIEIDQFLIETYEKYNYELMNVPKGTIQERADYILKNVL